MNSKQFRGLARENLRNRWGNAAVLMLVYGLLTYAINLLATFIPMIGAITVLVIGPVLTFGFTKEMILFKNGVKVECIDFFKFGFTNFTKVWSIIGKMLGKMLGPIILYFVSLLLMFVSILIATMVSEVAATVVLALSVVLLIAGSIWMIPISYKYGFVMYELVYSPNMTAKEIVEFSGQKMTGNRWRAFKLAFSFIGWILLAALGCYIPLLWISPYMTIASIIFYESLRGQSGMNFASNIGYNPQQPIQPNNQYRYNQQPQNPMNNQYGYNVQPQNPMNNQYGYNQQPQNQMNYNGNTGPIEYNNGNNNNY